MELASMETICDRNVQINSRQESGWDNQMSNKMPSSLKCHRAVFGLGEGRTRFTKYGRRVCRPRRHRNQIDTLGAERQSDFLILRDPSFSIPSRSWATLNETLRRSQRLGPPTASRWTDRRPRRRTWSIADCSSSRKRSRHTVIYVRVRRLGSRGQERRKRCPFIPLFRAVHRRIMI